MGRLPKPGGRIYKPAALATVFLNVKQPQKRGSSYVGYFHRLATENEPPLCWAFSPKGPWPTAAPSAPRGASLFREDWDEEPTERHSDAAAWFFPVAVLTLLFFFVFAFVAFAPLDT